MKNYQLITLIFVCLLFASCESPKALTKKGNKLQEQELHIQACDFYFKALDKDKNYALALSGLKKSGQRVINSDLDNFFKSKNFGNSKEAIYLYRDASLFQQRTQNYNIKLDIPSHYTNDYNLLVDAYVDENYEIALKLLEEEQFDGAEKLFKEIALLKPNYKDVNSLKDVAEYEPKFRHASALLEQEKFRSSYYEFDKIPSSYKETKELKALALQAGLMTIGIMDFQNATRQKGAESAISAYLTQEILNLNNPFIKLVDRSNTQTYIDEQLMGMSGQVDQNTSAQAGALIGAKVILSGKLVNYSKNSIPLKYEKKKAWLERRVKNKNQDTGKTYYETTYDKVRYREYYAKNTVNVGFQFQLTSAETGAILLTDIINISKNDEVYYATSNYNYRDLVPGNWKWENKNHESDRYYTSYLKTNQLKNLFRNKKDLKSIDNLSNESYQEISKKISRKIDQYNPENE